MNHGINLKKLIRQAPAMGIDVCHVRRTGELRFSHAGLCSTARVNGRRKDAPRSLTAYFQAAHRLQPAEAATEVTP